MSVIESCLAVVIAIVSIAYGFIIGVEAKEYQLVKSGHAEYYLDENNNKQWRMKK